MKQRLINFLLRKVAKVVIPGDILKELKGIIYLGKEPMTDAEKRSLKSEAKAIKGMRLWSILNETIKQNCYERGWRDSTTIEELNIAKSMYNVLDVQKSVVDKLANMVE